MSLNFSLEGHNGKVAIFKNIKFIHEMMMQLRGVRDILNKLVKIPFPEPLPQPT